MIADIETYLVRRASIKPLFAMESKYVAEEGDFLFRAVIDTRFSSDWKTTITEALDDLETVLRNAGEIL